MASTTSRSADLGGLASIAELRPRTQAVEAKLVLFGEGAFVHALGDLARRAALEGRASDAFLACALWLLEHDAARARLYEVARRDGARVAARMLAPVRALKSLSTRARLADVALPDTARRSDLVRTETLRVLRESFGRPPWEARSQLTAAEIVAVEGRWERSWDPWFTREVLHGRYKLPLREGVRQRIERLALHPSPFAIRRLLAERDTPRGDAVRVAARRPTTPAIVRELLASSRFIQCVAVREAIVANPFTPTATALLLLPTSCAMRAMATANVHPALRDLATMLLGIGESAQRSAPVGGAA